MYLHTHTSTQSKPEGFDVQYVIGGASMQDPKGDWQHAAAV